MAVATAESCFGRDEKSDMHGNAHRGCAARRGEGALRFDDMLATVVAQPLSDRAAAARMWRQLIDLLAQGRADLADAALVERVHALVRSLREAVPDGERAAVAADMAGRRLPAGLIALLADAPADPPDPPAATAEGGSQIRDLLARIDAFRGQPAAITPDPPIESFAFGSDAHGALFAVGGAALGASLADGDDGAPGGVDGQALGAWRRRAAFRDARLTLAAGDHAGEWRISAEPLFADDGGRWLGYRGTARRPRADETALAPSAATPDLARAIEFERFDRVVDALRGPLEAVARFGGAGESGGKEYRDASAGVIARGLGLLGAIDAFDLAAAALAADAAGERIDAVAVLARLHAAFLPIAEARGVRLSFRIAADLPPVAADPVAVERMFARLLGATLALGRRGERLVARLGRDRRDGSMLALTLSRPGRIVGRDERALLEPAETGAGFPDAPLLGLSFALRLVRNLAREAGGALAIGDDRLALTLPLRPPAARRERR